jgi:hypothetical protein
MNAAQASPNNLGPTLMIVLGACMAPLGIGIPIVLFALAQLRTKDGHRTYRHLAPKKWTFPG